MTGKIDVGLNVVRQMFLFCVDRLVKLEVGSKIGLIDLCKDVGQQFSVNQATSYPVVCFLVDGFPSIQKKVGVNGGLYKLNNDPIVVDDAISPALKKIEGVFQITSNIIETMGDNERIPATQIAQQVCDQLGIDSVKNYPLIKILLDNYPGIDVRRGARGGVVKLPQSVDVGV